ncbi:MAG: hypothetical protein ACRELB_01455, partial [Polyangiaceae bacterium]
MEVRSGIVLSGDGRTLRRALAGALVVGSLGACRAIADLRDLAYVPAPVPGGSVVLPTEGDARVRLVNAGTSGAADFCIRPSGSSAWGTPVLSRGADSCPGLDYAQATVPFAEPAGSIDVEAVPAGSSCDAPATSQRMGVPVGGSAGGDGAGAPVVTLVRFGTGPREQIVALDEEPPTAAANIYERLRFVNALSSGESIDFGVASAPSIPATVPAPLWPAPVPAGGVPPAEPVQGAAGIVDAQGYFVTNPLGVDLGVVFPGQTTALFVVATANDHDTQTVFALGDSGDDRHRIRGLVCEDAPGGSGSDAGTGEPFASCELTPLPALSVDTFDVSLYGAAAPFESDRRTYLANAIASRPTDVMCIVEADRDADKDAIIQRASGAFPYSYYPKTDLGTSADDPAGADGGVPPAPTAPPCAAADPGLEQATAQCFAQQCS